VHNRVVDITTQGAKITMRLDQLVISSTSEPPLTIPCTDLAVLVLSHPEIEITQPAMAAIMRYRASMIVCDDRRMPSGMLVPYAGHHLQSSRVAAQATVKLPKKKRIWQQIVREKILNQANVLRLLQRDLMGLNRLADQVRSGDPTNIEAQAARRYWSAMKLGDSFRRDPDALDLNRHLNYGYAVLRAFVARAICCAGLHPSLGVHHHNQFNSFCLADDLMEPFRPLIDHVVGRNCESFQTQTLLSTATKRLLIEALLGRCATTTGIRRVTEAIQTAAVSLGQVLAGESNSLIFPEDLFHEFSN